MGAGRSGSTILGVSLGNYADVFYAGELEAWLRRAGTPNFPGGARTEFWDQVRERVGGDDLFGDEAWRHLEYSLASVRPRSWLRRRHMRDRYRQVVERLYRVIASCAQVTHIVDTSHYPLRAWELKRLGGINLYIILLVRDPRNVTASFKRQDVTNVAKSLLATNAYLGLTHLLSLFVYLQHPPDRRLLLRYESLTEDPESVMRDIAKRLGLSMTMPDLNSLQTGIPFQGNRLLEKETIAMQRGIVPTPSPSYSTWITSVLQFPWRLMLARLSSGPPDQRTP
jgi:hypothetical protein